MTAIRIIVVKPSGHIEETSLSGPNAHMSAMVLFDNAVNRGIGPEKPLYVCVVNVTDAFKGRYEVLKRYTPHDSLHANKYGEVL